MLSILVATQIHTLCNTSQVVIQTCPLSLLSGGVNNEAPIFLASVMYLVSTISHLQSIELEFDLTNIFCIYMFVSVTIVISTHSEK